MIQFLKIWLELNVDRRAVTALEYALVAAAVGLVVTAAFTGIGAKLATKMTNAIGT